MCSCSTWPVGDKELFKSALGLCHLLWWRDRLRHWVWRAKSGRQNRTSFLAFHRGPVAMAPGQVGEWCHSKSPICSGFSVVHSLVRWWPVSQTREARWTPVFCSQGSCLLVGWLKSSVSMVDRTMSCPKSFPFRKRKKEHSKLLGPAKEKQGWPYLKVVKTDFLQYCCNRGREYKMEWSQFQKHPRMLCAPVQWTGLVTPILQKKDLGPERGDNVAGG